MIRTLIYGALFLALCLLGWALLVYVFVWVATKVVLP